MRLASFPLSRYLFSLSTRAISRYLFGKVVAVGLIPIDCYAIYFDLTVSTTFNDVLSFEGRADSNYEAGDIRRVVLCGSPNQSGVVFNGLEKDDPRYTGPWAVNGLAPFLLFVSVFIFD